MIARHATRRSPQAASHRPRVSLPRRPVAGRGRIGPRTLTIRRCRLADAQAVAELAAELEYPTDAVQAATRLACLLGHAEDAIFAAEGAVVGWLHAREMRELESEPCGEIAALVVAAPRRGQGFGKALVQAALAWAAERGLATMRVRSNVIRQGTHRRYQAAGFKVLNTQAVFSRSTTIWRRPSRSTAASVRVPAFEALWTRGVAGGAEQAPLRRGGCDRGDGPCQGTAVGSDLPRRRRR